MHYNEFAIDHDEVTTVLSAT